MERHLALRRGTEQQIHARLRTGLQVGVPCASRRLQATPALLALRPGASTQPGEPCEGRERKKLGWSARLWREGARKAEQGVAVLHFLKMRREAQRGKEEREGGAKVYSMRARASVASALASSPPACLKVHTTSYHFLGNGKIRRFGCSLLFSGVASVTHCGLFFALCGL